MLKKDTNWDQDFGTKMELLFLFVSGNITLAKKVKHPLKMMKKCLHWLSEDPHSPQGTTDVLNERPH